MQNSERALWRFSLIGPLLHLPPGVSLTHLARELAAQVKTGPDGEPAFVSPETLLRWLRLYQAGGLDGLETQPRSDRGRPRALDEKLRALLLDLAAEHGDWTTRSIHREAQKQLGRAIPVRAVYRLLHGRRRVEPPADEPRHRPLGIPQVLWLADTWHGPRVLGPRRVMLKTFLLVFLDDSSRAVMGGQFGLRDDLSLLLVVFRQALLARGLPHRLITDNGSTYRSRVFRAACARLGIHLVHAPKEMPTWKARLERFFLTVKLQLKLPTLPTLPDLHTAWARFLADYHVASHDGLTKAIGKPTAPLDFYLAQLPPDVKHVAELPLDDLLQIEETRRVNPDATFRVAGRLFEVRAGLTGSRVLVRFRPPSPNRVFYRPLLDPRASFQEAFPIL
jgi:putative transposase